MKAKLNNNETQNYQQMISNIVSKKDSDEELIIEEAKDAFQIADLENCETLGLADKA